jgi:hypothetical protein
MAPLASSHAGVREPRPVASTTSSAAISMLAPPA